MRQGSQRMVLGVGKGFEIRAFQFDPDRKIIATLALAKRRYTGMPCPVIGRNELHYHAVAANQEVGRHPQRAQLLKVRMGIIVQAIAE